MGTKSIYTKQEKQIVLACFRAGLSASAISTKLGFPIQTVKNWRALYLKRDNSWASFDDDEFRLRQEALMMFREGLGYKKVAAKLNMAPSKIKYWYLQYRHEQLAFFDGTKKASKHIPVEEKIKILNDYAITTLSKKAFCISNGISVATLNNWLKKEISFNNLKGL